MKTAIYVVKDVILDKSYLAELKTHNFELAESCFNENDFSVSFKNANDEIIAISRDYNSYKDDYYVSFKAKAFQTETSLYNFIPALKKALEFAQNNQK